MDSASSLEDASPAKYDPFREAKAYNMSIYMMIGMPYLLLSVVGFLIYRGLKRNAEWQQNLEGEGPIDSQGESECPPITSLDDNFNKP